VHVVKFWSGPFGIRRVACRSEGYATGIHHRDESVRRL
jgi:hypothetical protein